LGLSLLAKRYPRNRRRLHTITECRAEDNYTLWLRFNDGLEGHVYLGDLVHTQYFRMLCDIDTFNRVEVDPVEALQIQRHLPIEQIVDRHRRRHG